MIPDSTLITSKRNFLVRALGFTAAGLALPVPIVTIADARARMEHHIAGLKAAMADYYGVSGMRILQPDFDKVGDIQAGREAGIVVLTAHGPGWGQS